MRQPSKLIWLLSVLLGMLLIGHSASAKSARHWLRQGNKALAAEDFDVALEAYGKAELDAPESPYLAYNQGIAWYRQGDFNQAREHFQRANDNLRLLRRPDDTLAARSEIAIGNCWFREAQRQQDSNLQKSAEALTKSIDAYDRCLNQQPKNKTAQQNRQAARLLLKKIWAEQAARQAAQQQKQAKMQELAQRLEELTERQKEAAQQSQSLPTDGSGEAAQAMAAAARKQQDLNQDTHQWQEDFQAETGGDMTAASNNSPQDGSPQDPIKDINEEVAQAQQAQQQAEQHLQQQKGAPAQQQQQQAAKHLQNALDKWPKEQQEQQAQQQQGDEQQQQDGQQQDAAGQQEGEQEQQTQEQKDQQQNAGKNEDENAEEDTDEDSANKQQQADAESDADDADDEQQIARELTDQEARDILDQEKTDKRRRQTNQQKKYVPVAKDW